MSSDVPKTVRLTLATGLALLLLLTLVTAGIAGLLASESGTRWIAGLAVDRLGGGVHWGQLRGSLLGRLEITDLELDQPGFRLAAERAAFAWQPGALLHGELVVSALALEDGVLILREDEAAAASSDPFDPADLRLPVDVSISGVALTRLRVVMAGQTEQTIDTLALTASIAADRLELTSLTLDLPEGGLSLSGSAGLRSEMPVELTLLADGLLPVIAGAGATPTPRPVAAALSLDGSIDWRDGIAAALGYRVSVQGVAGLVPDLPDRVAASGRLSARQRGDTLQIEAASLALEDAGLIVNLRGQLLDVSTADPGVSAELDWEGLRWPLASTSPLFRSDAGRLSVAGRADDYRLALNTSAAGADLPDSRWTARAQGNTTGLLVETLRGELLDGWLEADGPITFGPQPAWDLRIAAGRIGLAAFLPELTAPLEGELSTRGRLDGAGKLSAEVHIEALRAAAGGLPVEVDGELGLDDDVLQITRLDLRSGTGRLGADGSVSASHLDLNWTLSVTDAGSFEPRARGRIDGSGRLSGHPDAPTLDATLSATGLGMDGIALENATVELVAGLAEDAPLAARLSLAGLSDQGEAVLEEATLNADGSTGDHRLTLAVTAAQARVDAELEGGLAIAGPVWQGRLMALAAGTDAAGTWDLEVPSPLTVGAEQLRLEAACLERRGSAGRLCLDGGRQSSGAADLELKLSALPLEAFLPTLTGELSGDLRAAIDTAGALATDGRFTLGSGAVRLPDDLDAGPLAHGGGHLTLTVDDAGLHTEADFAAPEDGRVDLEFRLPALRALPPATDQPLDARISAALPDLAILAALAEPIGHSAGRLSANLDLAGSLAVPLVDGRFPTRRRRCHPALRRPRPAGHPAAPRARSEQPRGAYAHGRPSFRKRPSRGYRFPGPRRRRRPGQAPRRGAAGLRHGRRARPGDTGPDAGLVAGPAARPGPGERAPGRNHAAPENRCGRGGEPCHRRPARCPGRTVAGRGDPWSGAAARCSRYGSRGPVAYRRRGRPDTWPRRHGQCGRPGDSPGGGHRLQPAAGAARPASACPRWHLPGRRYVPLLRPGPRHRDGPGALRRCARHGAGGFPSRRALDRQ
jgi:translocation and assembly module TamB